MRKISVKAKFAALALGTVLAISPLCYAYSLASTANSVSVNVPVAPVKGKDYTSIINNAKETKNEYQQKAQETQALIDNLKTEYNKLSEYINQLDIKNNQLIKEVAALEEKKVQLETAKKDTEEKLAIAEAKREEQYKTMSARIKYVYENGETSYLDILLNVGSLSDLLNRVEYVSEISEYDNNLFENYRIAAQEVADYKEVLDNQLEALDQMTETYNGYCDYAKKLADEKQKALEEVSQKLGTNEDVLSTYLIQIESANMTIAEAEAAYKAEVEAAAKAEEEKKKLEQQQQQQQGGTQQEKPKPPSTGTTDVGSVVQTDNSGVNSLIWPVPGAGGISSYFGPRTSPTAGASSYHKGIDIWCSYGKPIVAASAGTVVSATYSWDCGNYVMIQHADGNYTIYMHNSSLAVSAGQYVKQGQVIAYAGSTGISTGVHCHFGVMVNGSYVNPLNYVSY